MTTDHLTALAASADRLAEVRPEGRLALEPEFVDVLCDRIVAADSGDPRIAAAIAEGDAYAAAIDAGCPPQFHPGVAAEQATVLQELRTRLGLDRAEAIQLDPGSDPRHHRLLRAVGCEVVTTAA